MSKKKEFVVHIIERRTTTHRSPREVFEFLDRPSNLKRVTPESIAVSIENHPADLRPGTVFRYRLRRWPLDLSWDAVVSEYRPPEGFTHVKARGYFPKWALSHEIVPMDDGSELRMCLEYEVPSGVKASLSNSYVIRNAMEELVDAQIAAMREALEAGA